MSTATATKTAAAPPSLWENPLGTDGFEFVEFVSPEPETLKALFEAMGFVAVARHRSKNVTLYRQGDVNFILNEDPYRFAADFARAHGPSACAMAFRVKDAGEAMELAIQRGAEKLTGDVGPMELNIPAIEGIGASRLYLVDRYGERGSIYDVDFLPIPGVDQHPRGLGLDYIDHLTHNVATGNMAEWRGSMSGLFNFREIRYFDIEGKVTGLRSKAMTSPCGKIRIPINASADDKSQIAEYLELYKGEGIQHVALGARDIYATVEAMQPRGVSFLDTPGAYFDAIGGPRARPRRGPRPAAPQPYPGRRCADRGPGPAAADLHRGVIGPIFFEIIQRKGNEGFGEGNFKALFEAMEEDQIRRGVLEA